MFPLLSLTLRHDEDVVAARRNVARLAALLEFDSADQTRLATAVSEIVRNAVRYARHGEVHFQLDIDARPQQISILVQDRGPGIPHLEQVLAGRFQSATGMGMGLIGVRRLMDHFSIDSSPEGTRVVMAKSLPAAAPMVTRARAREVADAVRQRPPQDALEEVQQQNQELLRALDALERNQQELTRLNRELEDTNRGVVALYAELDEKADHLRRADDLKSRFLSNMTHEFRTPVNAIIGLCNLMRDDRQREGREAEPELEFIAKAADQLWTLVNDLLDLAKVEAGKTVLRAAPFEVQNLFGALRGMLRPLLLNQSLALVFEDAPDLPPIHSDEAKVSQILRNLISNALKFTERGEVRVSAAIDDASGRTISFKVADTGIGIAPEDQSIIFEEFGQIEHRLQRKVRGTGLGLPLSRRLAELLGGTLTVESEPGAGSVFTVTLPTNLEALAPEAPVEWTPDPLRVPLLVIEDAADAQFMYDRMLKTSRFHPYPARTVEQAEAALDRIVPAAIVLDLVLQGEEAWDLLVRLKRDERTRRIPVVMVSVVAAREKALALGADAFLVKPIDRHRLIDALDAFQSRLQRAIRVLVIDDEERVRYMVRQYLPGPEFQVTSAPDGQEGLERARQDSPDVIMLDLVMPGRTGQEVVADLRADPRTRDIPIVIVTGAQLTEADARRLRGAVAGILSKADLTPGTLADVLRTTIGRAV